ncbi:MAG: M56 family metallopeptidase [Chloracidobacterium sp.]|nr:M56 family metallopeptidase [Chloracidobacterium sp.]
METISRFTMVFLINALWQTVIVALSASFCDRLMRNAPARYRHRLWVIALALCLLLPLSGLVGFQWLSFTDLPPAGAPQVDNQFSVSTPAPPGIYEAWLTNFSAVRPAFLVPRLVLIVTLISCYLLSLLCHLMKIVRAWRRTNEIYSAGYARDIPDPMARAAARCREAFDLGLIPILSSSVAPAPMTLGIFLPVIILPDGFFQSASMEAMVSALGHEMAHIRRRDFALNLIYELLRLPLAFHPAVALMKRRIDQTRELACDEMVSGHLVGANVYARSLVYMASLASNLGCAVHSYNQNMGALDADNLEERVMRLIDKKPRHSAKRAVILLIAATLALTLSGIAASAFSLRLKQDKSAKPNFSGKWRAEKTTNEVGELPFPPGFKGETLEVEHKDPELKAIFVFEADKQWTGEKRFTIDGAERARTFGNFPGRTKAEWSGKQLIITAWFEIEGRVVNEKEVWELADDQKTLIMTREHAGSRAKTIFKRE